MAVWIRSFPRRAAASRKLNLPGGATSLRIAQISLPGALFHEAHYFEPRRGSGLEEFRPQVLIGSAADLSILAQAKQAGQIDLTDLTFAVYSVISCRDMPLDKPARTSLWATFGVPVRELLLDSNHMPVAVECEAHEGWHIEPDVTFTLENGQLWFRRRRELRRGTGLTGRLDATNCPCGRSGTRIVDPRIDLYDPLRLAV